MALKATKENVMSAISTLGFEVFKDGHFHWNSSNTPDMLVNDDGSIHCWTDSPFSNNKNHGDLIDFIKLVKVGYSFKEAKKYAYELLSIPVPSMDSYKDNGYSKETVKKSGFITDNFIEIFETERKQNFKRFMELLNEALPSLNFEMQKKISKKYKIGYSKEADRLIMPIRDEFNRCLTLWKYNKNPKPFINDDGDEVKPNKVTFTRGRSRCPFNLADLLEYRKDKNKWIVLCAGEKDTLNAIGNGYRAITLGAENASIPDKYKELFKGLKIMVVYDYDKAGRKGTEKVIEELKDIADEVTSINWIEQKKKHNLKLFKGYDFTDYLTDKNRRKK